MRSIPFIFIPTLLLILLSSCEEPDDSHRDPHEVDDWVYLHTDYDQAGNVVDVDTFAIHADSHGSANGYYYAFLHNYNSMQQTIPCGDYRMTQAGLYRMTSSNFSINEGLFLPYPGIIGLPYTTVTAAGYVEQVTLISKTASLVVPYGSMNDLYQYEFTHEGLSSGNIWFDADEWFVKYEKLDTFNGGAIYLDEAYELMSYTPQ